MSTDYDLAESTATRRETGGGQGAVRRIPEVSMARWSGVDGRPLVIAGPCSAESEEQLVAAARRLHGVRVDYFRAGIWKARTRPDSFEGIGAAALPWLKRAAEAHGLKSATEVARAEHVESALEAGIDLLWVGARTTANPFSVQEIANALRGTDVPVLVKNPISSDLALWIGGLERIAGAGIGALGAIHRGVARERSAPYRNAPAWEMAIELRRLMPELPILCDPSHISGRRDLIARIAQRAMDLGLDGLMIEVHPDPDQAWSDADQQITPERMGQILSELHVRAPDSKDEAFVHTLTRLREQIDEVDDALMQLLAERSGIVHLIGEAKKDNNVMPLQASRWRALLEQRMQEAVELGLDPQYVKSIYDIIHGESVRRQSLIISGEDESEERRAVSEDAAAEHGGDGDALADETREEPAR